MILNFFPACCDDDRSVEFAAVVAAQQLHCYVPPGCWMLQHLAAAGYVAVVEHVLVVADDESVVAECVQHVGLNVEVSATEFDRHVEVVDVETDYTGTVAETYVTL